MEEGQDAVVWISERSIAKRTYLPRDPPKRRKGPNRKKKKKKNHMQLLGPGPRQHDDKEVELTGEIGGLEATAEGGLRPGAEATAGRTRGLEATAEGTGGQSHCREDSGAGSHGRGNRGPEPRPGGLGGWKPRPRGPGALDGFYGYGVYVCLPKSVIRHVIRHVYAP
jgi:hypothetical protein